MSAPHPNTNLVQLLPLLPHALDLLLLLFLLLIKVNVFCIWVWGGLFSLPKDEFLLPFPLPVNLPTPTVIKILPVWVGVLGLLYTPHIVGDDVLLLLCKGMSGIERHEVVVWRKKIQKTYDTHDNKYKQVTPSGIKGWQKWRSVTWQSLRKMHVRDNFSLIV